MVVLYFFLTKSPSFVIQEIANPFWAQEEIKADVLNVLVNHAVLNKDYVAKKNDDGNEAFVRLHISSKLIFDETLAERQLLLVIRTV